MFFLSIFRENLHPFCELKILYYLCIPFRTQNAAASNQVVFSDGLHVMSLPEGVCERVVIGSQARLRIWCLRAYGFESLRSHFIKRSRSVPPVSFFAPARRVLDNRSGPRGLVPLCHCVTSPEGERKRLPPFQSLALFFGDRGLIPGLFFYARETSFGQSLRASRLRTPLSLRDISRGRTETSAAVSVARTFFRDRGVFPGLFFCARESGVDERSGPRGLVPLCHCVTSPEGERKRLPPFRSLARFSRGRGIIPGLFLRPRVESSVKSCPGERGIIRTNCVVYSICPD